MNRDPVSVYLGLDIGGTGAKAAIFDRDGRLMGLGHAVYAPTVTAEGHVEIPVGTIYAAARTATREALAAHPARVVAMAVASQGETFVSLDDRDRPLHDAIIWYDSRAKEQAKRLGQSVGNGGPHVPSFDPVCSAPKIMWLREHRPEAMRRARRFLLLPDYFAYRLTGQAVTDPNTATSTSLYAEDAPDYHEPTMRAAGIALDQVSRILPSGTPVATVRPAQAREWGLPADTLLVTGTNDQYAGALGAGNCRPGIVTETSGTCMALVTLTERLPSPMPAGLFGGRFPIRQYQFALAYSKTAGVVLDWFRRELCAGMSFDQLDAMAANVPIGSRGLTMIPHFDGMVSPAPDPVMHGAFRNLTLQHTRGDLYRSILEALSFSMRENVELLRRSGLSVGTIRSIGGGAKNDFWLQMKADVLGLPVEKPAVLEASTLGAAMLAALGHGAFKSLAEVCESFYHAAATIQPEGSRHSMYDEPYARYRAAVGAP